MRKLRYHEQRLLRKVNFIDWSISSKFEQEICSAYYISDRQDFYTYKKLVSVIKKLCNEIVIQNKTKSLLAKNLINRLYNMGIIKKRKLVDCSKVTVRSFCERRLPVIMLRNKMVQNLKDAVRFVEQGHVQIGTKKINNPSVLVSTNMDQYVQWCSTSKIKKHIDNFNDNEDDY